ncbi:MAG: penicillin acylase family protein [Vicinamibacterales bacterium]|nr:penicillin acylase family protein [Vicinamibacterales bacterium]
MRRRWLRLMAAVVLVALTTGFDLQAQGTSTTLKVAGLAEPVEILRDRWGINHIYARSEADLFFAQGYAAASDRLFQFEIWRRRATGTVAEMLGRRELRRDIGARLHMYRGDMDAELQHYHPRGKAIIEAYVAGINAYVDEVAAAPDRLPLEFRMLGITPGKWTPAVVISRHQALTSNVGAEVNYVRAMKALGADRLRELLYFQGGEPVFTLDPSIDLASFPDEVLELYQAFRSPIEFRAEDVAPAFRAARTAGAEAAPAEPVDPHDIGSNNWVVAGARTESGYPIMANDPHRVIEAPSLRYWTHLVAPGWDVIGGGEPVLPGVSIGHNGHGAWGLTIFGTDNEDLYVYDTNPENPHEYRFRGQWEPMRILRDTVPVKGEAAEAVELKYTRHGPVIYEDRAARKAYAIRAAWLEQGGAPYLASLRMNQARTWEEFREACTYNRMPSENMVWADRTGTIGWQAAGITPLRRNWSGLLPVPGDGRYEWDGFLPIAALPHLVNPPEGFVATANNHLFPQDYPWPEALHFTGADPYRAARVEEVLGSGRKFSVAETARLQNDDLSIPARALVPLLRDLALARPASAAARDRVVAWDFVLDKDSVPAGIFQMFSRRLYANVREALIPVEARAAVPGSLITVKPIIDRLYAPDGRFGEDPIAGRDALVARSLDEAVAELTKRFGPDMDRWRYGQAAFHHALIRHPLSDVVNAETRARLEVGPAPRGGDALTVSATGSGDNQTSGGSFKIIVDTGNWENSVGINTPGQAGNPDDPNYRALFPLWSTGRYFPLAYARARVESVTTHTTRLEP